MVGDKDGVSGDAVFVTFCPQAPVLHVPELPLTDPRRVLQSETRGGTIHGVRQHGQHEVF